MSYVNNDNMNEENLRKIVDLELKKVVNRLEIKNIKVKFSEDCKKLLLSQGFDHNLGARPLKRVIQKKILDSLAIEIVSGLIKEGNDILVDAKNNEIVIRNSDLTLDFSKKEKVL